MSDQAASHPTTSHAGFLTAWLAWIPYIVLSIFSLYTAAFLASFVIQLYQVGQAVRRRNVGIIDIATLAFFTAGVIAVAALRQAWFATWASAISYGLFALIAFGSLALREPFTIHYARASVPAQFWQTPQFLYENEIITAVWGFCFLAGVLCGAIATNPKAQALNLVGLLALVLAVLFTARFPAWYGKRAAARRAQG